MICPRQPGGVFLFLSTPSARRATGIIPGNWIISAISIHALREEGDILRTFFVLGNRYFYPRPPRGGRRKTQYRDKRRGQFLSTPSARRATHQKRTAWEGRPFLSTPSARRATKFNGMDGETLVISIHALREEGDSSYLE